MKDFRKFINRAESAVLVLSIIGVFFLILQLGFIKDMEMPAFYEDYMNELEKESEQNNDIGYIVLKRTSEEFEKIHIKVNGKGKYKFDKNNELILKVNDGDIIELDNTLSNNEAILKVVGISKNVEEPSLNDVLTINESIKLSLEVKLK